jgi:sulfatase maturation enzyme AslB (radical SAM superfamily)
MHNRTTHINFDTFSKFLEFLPTLLSLFDCESVHVSYFGGEPLLRFDDILVFHQYLTKHDLFHSDAIISNGLLLDEKKVEAIKKYKIGFSFSFDGLWTDFQRLRLDGQPLLKVYESKKDIIKELTDGCKCMVSPQSVKTLVENLDYLVDVWEFKAIDFSIVRDNIWKKDDIENFRIYAYKYADRLAYYWNKGF